jgi:hypothetical protein
MPAVEDRQLRVACIGRFVADAGRELERAARVGLLQPSSSASRHTVSMHDTTGSAQR